jgi:hypothetical protein
VCYERARKVTNDGLETLPGFGEHA